MGSRERYFGTPENSLSENSLLKQGVAVAAAGVLALSLSACKTTNATYPNSGSEISTSVGNGDEAAPGVSYDNDNGKWEKVEATAGTNTDPSIGFAVVDRTLTACMGDDLYRFDSPDQTVSPIPVTSENLVSANDPACIGSRPDSSSGWIEFKIGGHTSTRPESFVSCVTYREAGEEKKAEIYALGNGDPITLRGGCPFTKETNS
jgi:hypothetical protein